MLVSDLIHFTILSESTGYKRPDKIFLSKALYQKFIKEVEPIYKEQYGSFLTVESVDHQNILYKGHAVCLSSKDGEVVSVTYKKQAT